MCSKSDALSIGVTELLYFIHCLLPHSQKSPCIFLAFSCFSKKGSYFLNVQSSEPYGLGPQTRVVLKSITRAPTIVQTETKPALSKSQNQTTINNLVFNVPSYSSRFYQRYYKDDVTKILFSTLANFTLYDTKP